MKGPRDFEALSGPPRLGYHHDKCITGHENSWRRVDSREQEYKAWVMMNLWGIGLRLASVGC